MVNRGNRIMGRKIDRHPLLGAEPLAVYVKEASVIAGQALQSGVVVTPEGEMTFQPGDYIVTDNPPTHAWPVRQQVFELTYRVYEHLADEDVPVGPEPAPDYVPDLSVPPADAKDLEGAAKIAVPAVDQTAVAQEPQVASVAPKQKKGRGIVDSKSLGLEGSE